MKVSKPSVNYRKATGPKKCGACDMFEAPDDCSLVKGEIDPRDTCDEWVKIPPTVYVVRHGSTGENRGGPGKDLLRGHTDIPMDAKGMREIHKSADLLAHVVIPTIYASDLRRAVKTAEIIARNQIVRPTIYFTRRLRTWDLGDELEGQLTTPAVLNKVKNFIRHDTNVPPGGEAFGAFVSRILEAISGLFERIEQHGGIIALCTHGRVAQVLDLWIAAGCDEACMRRDFRNMLANEPDVLHPGGVARYQREKGKWVGVEIPEEIKTPGTLLRQGYVGHALRSSHRERSRVTS
jgi:broad specificity phosphatase PhoE